MDIVECPGCGQYFRDRHSYVYCCGHCRKGRGHTDKCHYRIVLPCRKRNSRNYRGGGEYPLLQQQRDFDAEMETSPDASQPPHLPDLEAERQRRDSVAEIETRPPVAQSSHQSYFETEGQPRDSVAEMQTRHAASQQTHLHDLEAEDMFCAVCLTGERTHACIPCGHRVLCGRCAEADIHERMHGRCPICRREVLMAVRIYG